MNRIGLIFIAILTTMTLGGCEDKRETNLFKAQHCIDTATAETVNSCLNVIGTQNSERANVMRCSAAFISEGIDEDAIVETLKAIGGKGTGNPTAPAIAALAMTSTDISTDAVEVCTLTGSLALTALANFANISTAMGLVLGGLPADPSPSDIEQLLANYDPNTANTADKEALGAAVVASQESLCNSKNGLFKDDKACTDINAAIAGNPNNFAAIADSLISNIND